MKLESDADKYARLAEKLEKSREKANIQDNYGMTPIIRAACNEIINSIRYWIVV